MQQKLCLWLCPAVLLMALCLGNPFVCRERAERDAGGASVGPAALSAAPAAIPTNQAPAVAPVPKASTADLRTPAPARDFAHVLGNAKLQPVNATAVRSQGARQPASLACPDPELAPLVVDTDLDDHGRVVWVLRDGQRLVRNPQGSHPLLVPAATLAHK